MEAKDHLKPGDRVAIPVTIKSGAFLNERFISLETLDGTLSGFVNASEIVQAQLNQGYIHGVIEEVRDESVLVRISGSFFTTTGLAALSRERVRQSPQ
jgi:hypothetical protein